MPVDSSDKCARRHESIRSCRILFSIVHTDAWARANVCLGDFNAAILDPDLVPTKVGTRHCCFYAQRLCDSPRPGHECLACFRLLAPLQDYFLPDQRHARTNENRMWYTLLVGHHIEKVMNTVAKIDLCRTARAIHGLSSLRPSITEGVARFVRDSGIRLSLGDDRLRQLAVDSRAKYLA